MSVLKRSYGYSKVDKEDPDEIIHRRAQFLIYKALEQADSRRKPSFIRIRLCRLKLKMGRKLQKLRKAAMSERDRSFSDFSLSIHKAKHSPNTTLSSFAFDSGNLKLSAAF
ncbi:hypothetical protein V6N13_084642 [Hibiscus sabdariffa]|uniref:Uncharacterized protein n=1 Tax=Hibiscus sabdariffa TaxID=183260 RepID=A0ABR2T1P0_9ROSI